MEEDEPLWNAEEDLRLNRYYLYSAGQIERRHNDHLPTGGYVHISGVDNGPVKQYYKELADALLEVFPELFNLGITIESAGEGRVKWINGLNVARAIRRTVITPTDPALLGR